MKPVFTLTGTVVHGKGLGHTVGMPTANLDTGAGSLSDPPLKEGVYSTLCHIGGETIPGVTNVGRRPTVDRSSSFTIETLLLDFCRDIYGATMTVEFYQYLRPVQKFPTLLAVKEQVEKDSIRTKNFFIAASAADPAHQNILQTSSCSTADCQ